MEKMKTTAPVSSVGADGVQPNVKNHNEIIVNSQEQINQQATKNPEKSGNDGLHTMSMPELYDTVFVPRVPIVDGFLYGSKTVQPDLDPDHSSWHNLPIMWQWGFRCGIIRCGKERCCIWHWKMIMQDFNVDCLVCLV